MQFSVDKQRWFARTVVTAIFVVMVLFFLAPHHEYVPKLLCLLVIMAFAVRYWLLQNRRAALVSACGGLCVLTSLPHNRVINLLGTVLVMIALSVIARLTKRNGRHIP